MTDTTYGRSSSLSHPLFGNIIDNEMRGCTYNRTTDHLWAHTFNFRGNDNGTNSTVKMGLYATNSSKNPTTRMGYSESISVTSATEQDLSGAVDVVDVTPPSGVTFSAIPLQDGTRYHIAVLNVGATIDHAMQQASAITADNEYFYFNFGETFPPPDPFGGYTTSLEGHMTNWMTCEINVAPSTPTSLSPSGTINETAPTFAATFSDSNSDRGDYLNQMNVQVRRVSDGAVFWNTTLTSTQAERVASAMSRAYGGTTLVRGTAYEWRTQHSDHFGQWSSWTAWTSFTPANLGFVTLGDDPTGTIQDNTPDFDGTWTHQSAEDMTVVQVRLWNGAGTTILQTGDEYDITDVADTDPFTVAWANTGFTTLDWGTSYQFQIRGKDESALWSDWSALQSFSTNAAPSIPTNLDPTASQVLTDYPLLTCEFTDADDTTGSGLTGFARIKDSGGSVLSTETLTYNGTTGKWEFQTTSSELATFATYRWDAYSYDGTLYSGAVTDVGDAVKSSESIFVFAEGPTVTITAPTENEVITTANLSVTWTTTDQQKYRVYLYENGSSTAVYDSGETVSTTSSHTIPSGYLENDTAYDLIVWVEDSDPLEGQSAIRNFTVDYVEPDAVSNFAVSAIKVGTDLWESAYHLTWDQTTYGTDVWQEYTIRRQAASGVDTASIILARLTSPLQVSYIDYVPQSGVEYVYSITQTILTGIDLLTSAASTGSPEPLALGGVVLCSVSDPENIRTALRYTNERDYPRDIDEAVYQPLNGAKPTTVRSRTYVVRPEFDVRLFDDDEATATARRLELEAIDQTRGTICYRDNHGRKYFLTLPDVTPSDRVPDWYVCKVSGREEAFTEGVS